MAMRMTGMMSGLDTESIIQELVAARQKKVDVKKKEQTKLNWKQEAWKELNSKLKSLQTKYFSKMRFSDAYTKKTTKVSNSNAVSVITGENAVNGVQTLEVEELAKTGYLTGGKIEGPNGEKRTALSTMNDIMGLGDTEERTLTIEKKDGSSVDIKVTGGSTISDVLTQIKAAGLNATFDANNQRFFISSPESGKKNDFSIKGKNGTNDDALLLKLGLKVDDQYKAGINEVREGYATKTDGQDAVISLNGAKFTSDNNTFEINGLTITALDKTDAPVTITTQQDTDGIYDLIKNFLKEYNAVVNEMDKLYNADLAKGYEPLTDEEKDAMSEKEVEKWEQKIKDSVLRRDDNLSTVNSALQSIMADGIEVNGKTMYLDDFGIETLGYFQAADNERHAYHIAGDPDDEFTMNSEDKLKSMISNDPDTVISFFSQLGRSLYDKMFDMSKSVDGYRSFGNFYDDKKMKSDYDDYTTKIKEMEAKLTEYEDKWYRKFSKMETALAKMQSNMSAVTGLLGG